jgi:hypothetical protein
VLEVFSTQAAGALSYAGEHPAPTQSRSQVSSNDHSGYPDIELEVRRVRLGGTAGGPTSEGWREADEDFVASRAGADPHGPPRATPAEQQLVSDFFDGAIPRSDNCGGGPCYASEFSGP